MVLRGLLYFTSMFSLLGIALLTILAVQHRLTQRERWALYAGIVLTALLRAGSGLVSNVVILAITVFLAVWAGGGRLGFRWVVIAALSMAAMVGMRSVAMEYRARSWFAETQLSLAGSSVAHGAVARVEGAGGGRRRHRPGRVDDRRGPIRQPRPACRRRAADGQHRSVLGRRDVSLTRRIRRPPIHLAEQTNEDVGPGLWASVRLSRLVGHVDVDQPSVPR